MDNKEKLEELEELDDALTTACDDYLDVALYARNIVDKARISMFNAEKALNAARNYKEKD